MTTIKTIIKVVSVSLIVLTSHAFANSSEDKPWPYPEDTPAAAKLSIGMASDRPVDISRFLLARSAYGINLNSIGTHVAFLDQVTGRSQLWVKEITSGHTKQITFGNGVDNYAWHPDGIRLIYSADNDGDEREAYYLMNIDGTQEEVVLSHSKAYRVFGHFSAAGNTFTYASTERNGRDFDIYLYDFETKKSSLIYQSEFGYYPSAWQPQSNNLIVKEVRGEDGFNLHLLNAKTGKLTTLYKPEVSATFDSIRWAKDGSGFYMSSDLDNDMRQILYHDMDSGKAQVVHTSEYDLENVKLCYQSDYLTWVENDNGFYQLYVQNLKNKKVNLVDLPTGRYATSCTDKSKNLVVSISSFNSPGSSYVVDLSTRKFEKLIEPQMAGIKAGEMVEPQVVTFAARDGVTVQGLLYMPEQKDGEKPAVVFNVHGGPTAQSVASWRPISQYLVGKGIAVFDINVRGSTGFGKTYARLDNQEKRLDSVRDLVDALAYFKEDGRLDTSRAGVMGGSYGGYMVNAVMGLYPEAFKAGASFVGVSNWVRALETASPGLKASDLIEYGDIREPKWQTFYAENSPINTVHKIKAPMLFQHGVNDPRDPVAESDEMVKALRERNIDVTYLRFPDEGHGISKLENRVIFYRALAHYLETHL